MMYQNVVEGVFLDRPNRFIANVEIGEKKEVAHVKNTGRCRELLIKGAKVYLQPSDNPNRKTKFDLISVYKEGVLVNIDSQVPNAVIENFLKDKNINFIEDLTLIKRESTYKNSRFDFYLEAKGLKDSADKRKIFAEVKGVTLEENGVALFPDAPTERGVKHLEELIKATKDGYEAYVFFLVQMKGIEYFTPNIKMHEEFGKALKKAEKSGVKIIALDSIITSDNITYDEFIPVRL